jgi:hypothetical protein
MAAREAAALIWSKLLAQAGCAGKDKLDLSEISFWRYFNNLAIGEDFKTRWATALPSSQWEGPKFLATDSPTVRG